MLRNYLKIACRNLLRNRVFSLINIIGLGLGIAAFVFILEYVSLEKSMNQFHANISQMYRLVNVAQDGASWPEIEPGYAPIMEEKFPEIDAYCRFAEGIATGVVQQPNSEISFREQAITYADGNFFTFFSFSLVSGNATALRKPNAVFISESAAKKYFGSAQALGETLILNNQFGATTCAVAGIFADMTDQSDIRFDMVISLETLNNSANLNQNDWARTDNLDSQYIHTFFSVKKGTIYSLLEKKLTKLRDELN